MTVAASRTDGRLDLLGIPIDPLTLDEAVGWTRARAVEDGPMLLVHTVNVDHVVVARRDPEFMRVSREAELSVADGMPIVWSARLLGHAIPERVTGVDLFERIADADDGAIPTFLFGAQADVAARAAGILSRRPGVRIVGVLSPTPEELADPVYDRAAVEAINASGARILVVALGAPKQEKWLARHAADLRVRIGVGVGATLDFIAGEARRAPAWMQRRGLEWLFRLVGQPVRLGRRYLVRDPVFGLWVLRELVRSRRRRAR